MTKDEAKKKITRILKGNLCTTYGGQFDSEKYVSLDVGNTEQDLFDFIEKYWNE